MKFIGSVSKKRYNENTIQHNIMNSTGGGKIGNVKPKIMKPNKRVKANTTFKSKHRPTVKRKEEEREDIEEGEVALLPISSSDSCQLSNTFFDTSKKVKVELITEVDNDLYPTMGASFQNETDLEDPTIDDTTTINKSIEEAKAIASISCADLVSDPVDNNESPFYDGTKKIRTIKIERNDSDEVEELGSSMFYHEGKKSYKKMRNNSLHHDITNSEDSILLRTLISNTSTINNSQRLRMMADDDQADDTYPSQIVMDDFPSSYGDDGFLLHHPQNGNFGRRMIKNVNLENGISLDDDEESMMPDTMMYDHQEIVDIDPVTVTCRSNGQGEEIIGYNNQRQSSDDLDTSIRGSSSSPPASVTTAERLHKACDVLLRAASKIHDSPANEAQHEEVVEETGEGFILLPNGTSVIDVGAAESDHATYQQPTPIFEIRCASPPTSLLNEAPIRNVMPSTVKKSKAKEKPQNISTQKECSNCHAVQTTIWRRDRFGNIVCNACGLYYKLHNYDRPCRMRRDEIHKRNRKRNSTELSNFGAGNTPSNGGLMRQKKPKRSSNGSVSSDTGAAGDPLSTSISTINGSLSDIYTAQALMGDITPSKKKRTSPGGISTPAPGTVTLSMVPGGGYAINIKQEGVGGRKTTALAQHLDGFLAAATDEEDEEVASNSEEMHVEMEAEVTEEDDVDQECRLDELPAELMQHMVHEEEVDVDVDEEEEMEQHEDDVEVVPADHIKAEHRTIEDDDDDDEEHFEEICVEEEEYDELISESCCVVSTEYNDDGEEVEVLVQGAADQTIDSGGGGFVDSDVEHHKNDDDGGDDLHENTTLLENTENTVTANEDETRQTNNEESLQLSTHFVPIEEEAAGEEESSKDSINTVTSGAATTAELD